MTLSRTFLNPGSEHCSDRISRDSIRGMPELIIVDNWRVRTARSLGLTRGRGGPKSPVVRTTRRTGALGAALSGARTVRASRAVMRNSFGEFALMTGDRVGSLGGK